MSVPLWAIRLLDSNEYSLRVPVLATDENWSIKDSFGARAIPLFKRTPSYRRALDFIHSIQITRCRPRFPTSGIRPCIRGKLRLIRAYLLEASLWMGQTGLLSSQCTSPSYSSLTDHTYSPHTIVLSVINPSERLSNFLSRPHTVAFNADFLMD